MKRRATRTQSAIEPEKDEQSDFRPAPRKRTFREAIRVLGNLSANKNEVKVAAPILEKKFERTRE